MQSERRRTMCSGTIDITEILHHIALTYGGEHDLLGYVAGSIYAPLKRYWAFLQVDGRQVSETLSGGWSFCTVPVVSRTDGKLRIFELQFPFSDSELLQPTSRQREESGIVWGQCPSLDSIDLDPQTPEAARACIEAIYRSAQLAYPDTVGGPTDIGIVDQNGARWLARKREVNEPSMGA